MIASVCSIRATVVTREQDLEHLLPTLYFLYKSTKQLFALKVWLPNIRYKKYNVINLFIPQAAAVQKSFC